jgi:histone demethylase JARID1
MMSGVSTPWLYMGSLFASFCWHVEDNYMFSLNYMHEGSPKTWYVIPESDKEKFDDFANTFK